VRLVVYVAGPFRASPDQSDQWAQTQNIRQAEALGLEVWRMGAAAVVPHLNTSHFQGTLPDTVWLDGDLAILSKCDAVLLTPDWAKSHGATAERTFALERGIPVFESIDELRVWVEVTSNP
jgi:nucleoside 2-deoxyribosyltransferase